MKILQKDLISVPILIYLHERIKEIFSNHKRKMDALPNEIYIEIFILK